MAGSEKTSGLCQFNWRTEWGSKNSRHDQGVGMMELFVNRVLTRMSVPRSLDYRIACELLAEIKREILVN